MYRFYSIAFLLLLLGCKSPAQKDLPYLNGYWEIEKVTFPNGNEREFKMNDVVDFIQIEGLEGYRKKVRPKLDGTFTASDDAERFTVTNTNGLLSIQYTTELSMWSEELTRLSQDRFTVRNEDGIVYSYKRFQPLNLTK